MITFVYALAVSASEDEKRSDLKGSSPLTVGLAVVACHLFGVSDWLSLFCRLRSGMVCL